MWFKIIRRVSLGLQARVEQRYLAHAASAAVAEPFEELSLSKFSQKKYYPVHPGDTLNERYRIISKLGFGAYSTVWLARDEAANRYTALKICVHDNRNASPVLNEVKTLQHLENLASLDNEHIGIPYTRLPTEIFEIDGPVGRHFCIAMEPQGGSLHDIQEAFPNSIIPRVFLKPIIQRLVLSLNWLQAAGGVIHTDLSAANIMIKTEDKETFRLIEDAEVANPSMPLIVDGYPAYRSRSAMPDASEHVLLGDFGSSRRMKDKNDDWWMSDMYRAPEVLLRLPWSWQVDMWSFGVMILELMEGRNLFDPMDRVQNQYVLPLALAQYIGVLGMPPQQMLERSPLAHEYFDESGNWAGEVPITNVKLEDFVTTIRPGPEKDMFLKFIRKLLTWDPEQRISAFDVFEDEWIRAPLPDEFE